MPCIGFQHPNTDSGRKSIPPLRPLQGRFATQFRCWLKALPSPHLPGASPTSLQIIDMIEQATQDLLATPEDTPLPNDPSDWRAVSERRENMSFIPVAVG